MPLKNKKVKKGSKKASKTKVQFNRNEYKMLTTRGGNRPPYAFGALPTQYCGDMELQNDFGTSGPLKLSSSNIGQGRKKSYTIVEDEYIGEVYSSVGFNTTSYPINIGQNGTFPWGSKIASLYEKYSFDGLEFYYRREVSEFSANGQTGKVMLSADFDATDPPPVNKQQVEDTDPHADGMPCTEFIALRLNPKDLKRISSLYIRAGAQPVNTDIKTYDVGNLYVSTQGCAADGAAVGELRVRYRCKVMTPVLENITPNVLPGSTFTAISWNLGEPAGPTTTYIPVLQTIGEAIVPVVLSNTIGIILNADGQMIVPNGVYLIEATNTTAAADADVENAYIFFSQTTGGSNRITTESSGSVNAGNNVWPHICASSNTGPYYFDTTIYGNSLYALVVVVYATGTPFTYSQVTITYLSSSTTKLL